MRFRRMWATGTFLLCGCLVAVVCSCVPTPKANETAPKASGRFYCSLAFVVDPAESPWEAPVRAAYRRTRDICNEHGVTISSSSMTTMTNGHSSLGGHVVHVSVWATTDEGARLAEALLQHIRCTGKAVFLEYMYISWRQDNPWENSGWILACFSRGSQEPKVERQVQETVPLDD